MLAAGVLETIGFEVVIAENGAIALEHFKCRQFDVVLMDCQMPVLHAMPLRVRSGRLSSASPVIERR
jgi:CheY-like chemotaxis protein